MRPKNLRNPFRAAIPYLWDGVSCRGYTLVARESYICIAISAARDNGDCSYSAMKDAEARIHKCLNKWQTVYCWLYSNVPEARKDLTHQRVQEYRHRWLNHLADQWDKGEICP